MDADQRRERRQAIRRLYLSGLSERAVAKQVGLSRSRVHQLLEEEGVDRRRVGAPHGNRNQSRKRDHR
jgi:transposase